MTTITDFSKANKHKGSSRTFWNVERNGVPFGQIWTWKVPADEVHPYHAKTADDASYGEFETLVDAQLFMTKL